MNDITTTIARQFTWTERVPSDAGTVEFDGIIVLDRTDDGAWEVGDNGAGHHVTTDPADALRTYASFFEYAIDGAREEGLDALAERMEAEVARALADAEAL
ncbi:MAG TPA: hypothetical protein VKZ89_20545 [Thermobifida alba]|nr:hypothetical protein [Thermobifida alba]